MRFNPPPNWPAPPAGWTPPSGWQPPPSWPPAPHGWPLWLDDHGSPAPTGRNGTPRRRSRRTVGALAVGGVLVALALGSHSRDASPTGAVQAASLTTVGAATAAASPAPASPAPAASSQPPASQPPASQPSAPSPAPRATISLTCPVTDSGHATFGHQISAGAPYTVDIDYGDGRTYRGDDRHLPDVFSHTYAAPGSFVVSAVLTDATGQSVRATCTDAWSAPVRVASASTGAGGGSASTTGGGPSGASSDTYVNSDGVDVHRPEAAPEAPSGATAQCSDGTYSFSLHHSGTCSHHGGVADWL